MADSEREYIREKSLEGQASARERGRHGGRPKVFDDDMVAYARSLRERGVPVPEIARKLIIPAGRNNGVSRDNRNSGHERISNSLTCEISRYRAPSWDSRANRTSEMNQSRKSPPGRTSEIAHRRVSENFESTSEITITIT
jgi:hypothetical protein